MPELRIGISGWTYAPWRNVFFPQGLVQKDELAFASRQVRSIEINGTFYSLQSPKSFAAWHDATPDDFVFAVKAPRFITHIRRLKEVAKPLANFWASGVLRLEAKLGPILWQLPPTLKFDPSLLADFFAQLPRDTAEAGQAAKRHDAHLRGKAWTKTKEDRPLRHALEVRHASFESPEFPKLLKKHRVGLVVADTAGKWPQIEKVTADFVYVRLHGAEKLYTSGYSQAALKSWGRKIADWNRTKAVYVYFDNDVKVHAPFDAMTLAHQLGAGPPAPPFPASAPEEINPTKNHAKEPKVRREEDRRPRYPRFRAS
jgi:uncharacterized protein YecE (DUF72 family)